MKISFFLAFCLSIMLVFFSGVNFAYAGTLYVSSDPGDYPSIKAAIDAAEDGDVVLVADGIYKGDGNRDISFLGKSISVKSVNGPEYCTIDCENVGTGFFFVDSPGHFSIEGFSIINIKGSGLKCENSGELLVSKCYFVGANIYLKNDNTMFCDCRFITTGIQCWGWSKPLVNDSIFSDGYYALKLDACSPTLTNVVISNMTTGIDAIRSSWPVIINSTIVGTSTGIYHVGTNGVGEIHIKILNSIIWDSTNSIDVADDVYVFSSHSNIQGGLRGEDNIDSNPFFVDGDNGDFRLMEGSPCLDSGTDQAHLMGNYTAPDHDIEGNQRPQGNGYDMGAYEGAVCLIDPIKIGDLYYDDLAEALAGCSGGETVQFHNGTYPGDLELGMPIVFAGGYDCLFQENDGQGSETVIDGSLTIVDGPIVIENVVFR